MPLFPVGLDLAGRDALVVGAGREIDAKVARLLEAGARVTWVSPGELDPAAASPAAIEDGSLRFERRAATEADLAGKAIAFLAPGDEPLARRLSDEARRTGQPLCTLDRPETSTFANAAVVTAGELVMTFGTGGASPSLARRIREDLGALFADERFVGFLLALRDLRAGLPRGERARRGAAAVAGFAVEGTLRLPAWFLEGRDPPG